MGKQRKKVKTVVFAGVVMVMALPFGPHNRVFHGLSEKNIVTVYAAEDMLGYKNPERIVIAMPGTEKYSTTASKISILGACDYRYPLTMNGKEIETTEHGFFTQYVSLSLGENVFSFQNGEHTYRLTVTRKKASGSSGGGSTATYKEVTNKIGEIKYPYVMPYASPGTVKIDYLPLTKNTTFRIVGEWGNYYKLPDGTYVEKSSVTVYPYKMPENTVKSTKLNYDLTNKVVKTTFTMKMDALYDVQIDGDKVRFVLYDTTASGKVTVPDNPLVSSVSVKKEGSNAVYTYQLKNKDKLCGFDVVTENGVMTFSLKYAPVLKKEGSLEGAVILLDAGHGGTDNGTVGAMGGVGPTEKVMNLDITLRVKKQLEAMGATVVLSRDKDTYVSLNGRVEKIRELVPDLSISIHGNAMGITSDFSKSAGFLTYYSYNDVQDAAGIINSSVNRTMGYTNRAPRRANLSLTRLTACPAVLLETAFLTYPEDYEYLLFAENREALATAIAKGAKDYIESVAVYEKTEQSYTVKRGDTLSAIARKFGVSVSAIAKRNNIKNINVIHTGSVFIIPVK